MNLNLGDQSSSLHQIETYCRLCPTTGAVPHEIKEVKLNDGSMRSVLDLSIPLNADSGLIYNYSDQDNCISFEFNAVYGPDATQEDIFEGICAGKVREVLNGINATIFAYGQTGSGKTYSMFCGDTFENRGIVPRCLTQLFKELAMSDNAKVQISFTEVFNEQVYDLLDAEKKSTPKDKWQPVQLLDTGDGGILLKGLNVYEVPEEEDALSLFFMGYTNRASCSTHMNAHSSRSHAIFSISLETQAKQDGLMITSYSKLNLVDLAGSERVFKAEKSEELRTQGRRINLSLHHLEHTIVTLRDKNVRQAKRQKATSGQDLNDSALSSNSRSKLSPIAGSGDKGGDAAAKDHIPYRNSVLTWLLRDSLGGQLSKRILGDLFA